MTKEKEEKVCQSASTSIVAVLPSSHGFEPSMLPSQSDEDPNALSVREACDHVDKMLDGMVCRRSACM
jgi:hypothetical protein